MPLQVLLGPIVLYVGASLLLPRLRPWLGPQARTLGILLSSVLAFLSILLVVQLGGEERLTWTLSTWRGLAGVGEGVQVSWDPLARVFLLLVGLGGMGLLVGSLDSPEEVASDDYQAGILALLGGLALMALANNLLTILLAEFLINGGLIFALGMAGQPRWFLVTMMHTLLAQALLLGAAILLWQETGFTSLAGASGQVSWLLILAALAHMAVLPFSLYSVAFEPLPQRVLALLPLLSLGTGTLLLGRLVQAVGLDGLPDLSSLAALGALGVVLGGWVAWRREELSIRLLMIGGVQAAWVLWALAWGYPSQALSLGWASTLALMALALHGGRLDFRHGTQLLGVIAALMLVGAPGSALWPVIRALAGTGWANGSLGLLTMGAVGMMGVVVALIGWLRPEESAPIQRSRWVGVTLLTLLSIPALGAWWGLQIPVLPAQPLPPYPWPVQFSMLLLGWCGGLWLWRTRDLLRPLRPGLDLAAGLFSFVWLWRLLGWVGWLLLSAFRGMVLVLEGENYGWLLLFLFVTMIFLLQR